VWFYVPVEAEKQPWVGTISKEDASGSRWTFEAIRHVTPESMMETVPFDDKLVHALLDYQQRCTILRPLVTLTDPGKLGVRLEYLRTRVKGQFDALLYDLEVTSEEEPCIAGFSFDSSSFAAWFATRGFEAERDDRHRTRAVQFLEPEREEFEVAGWGEVTCTAAALLSSSQRSAEIRSSAVFKMEFAVRKSLKEVIALCHGFEHLFGYLIGYRLKPPSFRIWTGAQIDAGDFKIPEDGTLELGGLNWVHEKQPHPFECASLRGRFAVATQDVVTNYLNDPDDLSTRMHAVDFCRHLSNNLSDRFSVLMPVLEDYLKKRYIGPDESNYLSKQTKFFSWIDSSDDTDVQEFSKKHVVVEGSKAPGLKTLLARAIDDLNSEGFSFPPSLAGAIQKRRGRAFHAPLTLNEGDARKFFHETRAATGILMLLTYRDLGVPLASLKEGGLAYRDLRGFVSAGESQGAE
jgi:hypothetical protein